MGRYDRVEPFILLIAAPVAGKGVVQHRILDAVLSLLELVEKVLRELRQDCGKFRFRTLPAGENDVILRQILFHQASDFRQVFRVIENMPVVAVADL